ncbi:MAG: RnfABCDGE type electron transport complex subunit D [Candidatus Omnitrophica bacterium]|nr:RnfABCDGE type electron transport complex subunit D [Candidatus Omnitrophota bacterium]
MLKINSVKTQLIIFLVTFAVFLSVKEGDFTFAVATIIAVISASTLDAIALYLKKKGFQLTESSVITGLIIGYVLASDGGQAAFVLAALLAVFSKHVIRYRNTHIFNPAAFGIFLTLILFNASTQWRGTYSWYILAPFGLYFAHKIRKIEVIIGYAVVALGLFGAQAVIQKVPLVSIFGYLSYFFIFVMVIEPKTTPVSTAGKLVFGAGVAFLIFVLTELGARFDVELCSLLVMNAAVPALNHLSPK